MALRNRLNVAGAGMPRQERADIWVAGYHAAMTSVFNPELDITDENTPVFNFDSYIYTRVLNAGTLALTEYDHPTLSRDVVDVLQNIDPRSGGPRGYRAIGTFTADVVRNTKHPTAAHYIKAELFSAWNSVLRPTLGAPKEAGTRVLDGHCELPLEFRVKDEDNEMIAVAFDIAEMATGSSNVTGTLGSNTTLFPVPDVPNAPELTGLYALVVEAQKRDNANKIKKASRLTVTSSMVDASGNVTITDSDLSGTAFVSLADVTHAHVFFLVYASGNDVTGIQLLGADIPVRGRFDVVT